MINYLNLSCKQMKYKKQPLNLLHVHVLKVLYIFIPIKPLYGKYNNF